ncbi:hypothetical protein FHW94_003194 [Novosphingobium sp. SG720]|nr:hypothetical protein [Novosphingobium sp. SG720]
MTIVINPAWKDIIVHSATPPFEPRQQAGPGIRKKFKLNRPPRFLLHHDCSRSDLPAAYEIANFHANKVATAQLAVDCKVEQRPIPQAAALIEVKADLPNLLWLQRPLCADRAPSVPDRVLGGRIHGFRHFHDQSPIGQNWPF